METALNGGGGLMNQLRKSYSVGDLTAQRYSGGGRAAAVAWQPDETDAAPNLSVLRDVSDCDMEEFSEPAAGLAFYSEDSLILLTISRVFLRNSSLFQTIRSSIFWNVLFAFTGLLSSFSLNRRVQRTLSLFTWDYFYLPPGFFKLSACYSMFSSFDIHQLSWRYDLLTFHFRILLGFFDISGRFWIFSLDSC